MSSPEFSALREIRPAWPGFDQLLYDRYRKATVKEIKLEQFITLVAARPIEFIGQWNDPDGDRCRIFYLGPETNQFAIAITFRGGTCYKLDPAPISTAPTKRRRLE